MINKYNANTNYIKFNLIKIKCNKHNLNQYFFTKYTTYFINKTCIFLFNIKFKYNYRFTISLMYFFLKLLTISSRNNTKLGAISKKNRYCIVNIFLLKCISNYNTFIENSMTYFFYKNTNMQTLSYLKLLYKLLKLVDTSTVFGFIFNLNASTYPNKCFKKIKTIKKFQKKIFYKISLNNLKEFYTI